jgi:hypothetical protein
MSTNSFSKRIGHALAVRTDILLGSDPASASDDDGQQLTNTDGADDISNRLQTLLDIQAQLSDSSDSSDGDPLFTDNPRLAALFEKPRSGVDNDNLLRALGQVVSNSGGAGKRKKKKKTPQSSEEEVMVDSIHTPTEENRSNTEDEFAPDSPGVTFERDPSDDVGDVARDNDAGESPQWL